MKYMTSIQEQNWPIRSIPMLVVINLRASLFCHTKISDLCAYPQLSPSPQEKWHTYSGETLRACVQVMFNTEIFPVSTVLFKVSIDTGSFILSYLQPKEILMLQSLISSYKILSGTFDSLSLLLFIHMKWQFNEICFVVIYFVTVEQTATRNLRGMGLLFIY